MRGCVSFQRLDHARVDGLALMGHAGAADDLVVHVEMEGAVLDEEGEEVGDVARIELAGVAGDGDGQVERGEEGNPVVDLGFAGPGQLAVPSTGGCEVDEDGAGAHVLDGVASEEERRSTAGDLRGGDDDVGSLRGFGDEVAASLKRLLAEFLGVAALVFGRDAAEVDVEEL